MAQRAISKAKAQKNNYSTEGRRCFRQIKSVRSETHHGTNEPRVSGQNLLDTAEPRTVSGNEVHERSAGGEANVIQGNTGRKRSLAEAEKRSLVDIETTEAYTLPPDDFTTLEKPRTNAQEKGRPNGRKRKLLRR